MTSVLHLIELEESERIVPHGVAKRTWRVKLEGRWVPARLVPGAEIKQRQPAPGHVWSRSISLKLETGTWLELVQESPRARTRVDTFNILTVDQKSSTVRRTTLHEVQRDGRLSPHKRSETT